MLPPVFALVKDLFFATKMVKMVQSMGLTARTFDTAERLLGAAAQEPPSLILLDCEGLEREAFSLLAGAQRTEALKNIPRIGYLSHAARALKEEMLRAGCEHVYSKSEFVRELESQLVKYSHGFPSRV